MCNGTPSVDTDELCFKIFYKVTDIEVIPSSSGGGVRGNATPSAAALRCAGCGALDGKQGDVTAAPRSSDRYTRSASSGLHRHKTHAQFLLDAISSKLIKHAMWHMDSALEDQISMRLGDPASKGSGTTRRCRGGYRVVSCSCIGAAHRSRKRSTCSWLLVLAEQLSVIG